MATRTVLYCDSINVLAIELAESGERISINIDDERDVIFDSDDLDDLIEDLEQFRDRMEINKNNHGS